MAQARDAGVDDGPGAHDGGDPGRRRGRLQRLAGLNEEATVERLKVVRRELIDPAIAKNHGRIVKTTGDGMPAEFASADRSAAGEPVLALSIALRPAMLSPNR